MVTNSARRRGPSLRLLLMVAAVLGVLAGGAVVAARVGAADGTVRPVVATVALATSPPAPSDAAHRVARPLHVVTLGDSVPAGTACGCTPFGSLVARRLGQELGVDVVDTNDAVPGLTSSGLEASASPGSSTAKDLASADVVLVMIGANDVDASLSLSGACGSVAACLAPTIASMSAHVTAVLHRVRAGSPGARVVLLNYWNVWQDGDVARARGAVYEATAHEVTAEVNAALATVAARVGVPLVDTVAPFAGADDRADSALLAADGDHPDAAGHRVIAAAVVAQVPDLLRPLAS